MKPILKVILIAGAAIGAACVAGLDVFGSEKKVKEAGKVAETEVKGEKKKGEEKGESGETEKKG